ncbi:MAG TPA: tetratricopeptide repeat protein, partial [Caulobacter sp.]|nr:tetratricopeptide repeat protein [Caulobacter sp.]
LIRKGDNAAAVADLTRALALRPGFADAYYNRAVAFDRMGRKAEADQDYAAEKAARGAPLP